MDFALPFACPRCNLLSVAVGICPTCRIELVARAMEAAGPVAQSEAVPAAGDGTAAVHHGLADDCREAARILEREGIPFSLVPAGQAPARREVFEIQVPAGWEEPARRALAAVWEREAERQGLDPVTEGEALALDAQGLCPACSDPLLPGAEACPSCGIALA